MGLNETRQWIIIVLVVKTTPKIKPNRLTNAKTFGVLPEDEQSNNACTISYKSDEYREKVWREGEREKKTFIKRR